MRGKSGDFGMTGTSFERSSVVLARSLDLRVRSVLRSSSPIPGAPIETELPPPRR